MYFKWNILSIYIVGSLGGFNEGDWLEFVNYRNGYYIERDKWRLIEVEDELLNGSEGKMIRFRKR